MLHYGLRLCSFGHKTTSNKKEKYHIFNIDTEICYGFWLHNIDLKNQNVFCSWKIVHKLAVSSAEG